MRNRVVRKKDKYLKLDIDIWKNFIGRLEQLAHCQEVIMRYWTGEQSGGSNLRILVSTPPIRSNYLSSRDIAYGIRAIE